ncbi:protealysin inhibitor emfourin [Nocardia niigatensis]|uniref:protealysin inhibitor emfourin n=1 Tax=Nocardia niigatensis TaxID=209249 RepID=UPI00031E9B51|nr:protealysin inhibitor emfourin [Nocardia niigatensis]
MSPIRIAYRRSGGLAGLDLTAEVDAADLLPADAATAAGLLTGDPAGPAGTGVPDGFSYELTVSDGTRTRTHRWNQPYVPAEVSSLLASLTSRATPSAPA